MLHEILLSLSGHPSPLWQQVKASPNAREDGPLAQNLSPPERAMLATLGHLSNLHLRLRDQSLKISSSHPSMICRAVASSIVNDELAKFQAKVLEVECAILSKDAGYVGGYSIVPLSTVVGEFTPWVQRMEWMFEIVQFITPPVLDRRKGGAGCTGASLIDRLEKETYTGYSDLEEVATDLLSTAHLAWMRQVSTWLLYGKIPKHGAEDFFVQSANYIPASRASDFYLSRELIPQLLTQEVADSVFFIGNSLNHIYSQSRPSSVKETAPGSDSVLAMLPEHLKLLQSLTYPLTSSAFAGVISLIRISVSQNALSNLLPLSKIHQILGVFQAFLLLGRGEFAISLIAQADRYSETRGQTQDISQPVRKVGRIEDLAIKESEITSILMKTWSDLANIQNYDDLHDETLEMAKSILRLVKTPEDANILVSTLLPSTTTITLSLPPESPFHLFLCTEDITTYSTISSFLLSIRRAEIHLGSLWKITPLRRCHPTPLGPPMSATRAGAQHLTTQRARNNARMQRMRRQWAIAGKALFVMNELGAYFQGEVIRNRLQHFRKWIENLDGDRPVSVGSHGSRPATSSSVAMTGQTRQNRSLLSSTNSILQVPTSRDANRPSPSDPATLAQAHRAHLRALISALLLNNPSFINVIRDLLKIIDHFVGLFKRLQIVWQGLDLQEDEGIIDALTNYKKEEGEVWWEMASTAKNVDEKLALVVETIKDMDTHGIHDLGVDVDGMDLGAKENQYVPWKGRTIDRLIMKLDFLDGRRNDGDNEGSNVDGD